MNRFSSICVVVAIAAAALPAKLSGQTNIIDVNNGDVAGLISAINTANSDGVDDIINLATDVPAGTGVYTLSAVDNASNGLPVINTDSGHSVIIYGHGATIRRDSNGNPPSFRIFQVASSATVNIDTLTISNGFVGDFGGGIYNQGALTLNSCRLTGNSATGLSLTPGGGAVAYGAAIFNTGALVATDCFFIGNSVTGGNGHSGTSEKGGDGLGGAIYSAIGTLSVSRCTFINNSVTGGNHGSSGGKSGGGLGGAIYNLATGTISDSAFSGNSAASPGSLSAGGAFSNYGTLLVQNSTLDGNTAMADGGGIFNGYQGTLTLSDCSVLNNSATAGGGINSSYGSATVTNTTFKDNTAFFGGAIYNSNASNDNRQLTLSNCTLSGNSVTGASSRGGGIYNFGRTAISNCTFNGNSAVFAGGNIFTGGQSLTVGNTILKAGSSGSNVASAGSNAPVTSMGHNISSDNGGGFLNGPADMSNTDPKLDPNGLQDNDGPTQTIALLSNSPAINAGNDSTAPSRDQRGYFRNGISDIGAYEYQGGLLGKSSIARSGNDIVVSVEVVQGKTYRLERKLNMTDSTWQNLSPTVPDLTASGNDIESITDPDAISLGKAFYHVIIAP